jgi:hypothetical protein
MNRMQTLGEQLIDSWMSGQNTKFSSTEAEIKYKAKTNRFVSAIRLKQADRVPIAVEATFFHAKYAGISIEEVMYDPEKHRNAWKKMILDFDWDATMGAGYSLSGSMLEALDLKQLKWPGHGVDRNQQYQFAETEYMPEEDYDAFLDDPSDYMIRRYLPRVIGALAPFESLPPLHDVISYSQGIPEFAFAFSTPKMVAALDALKEIGQSTARWYIDSAMLDAELAGIGHPVWAGSFAHAPFDHVGNYLRGTRGIMIDMFRNPDKLLRTLERVLPWELDYAVNLARRSGCPLVVIFLHKGSKGFMSEKQFRTFYWPTLRKLMLGLIDQGLIPVMYTEGDYTPWFEIIKDFPQGKGVLHLDQGDIFKAKEILGDVWCISGNVPNDLLCLGTPKQVEDYCRKLIDVVGEGGGYILDAGSPFPDAKIENVRAMTEFTKEYGNC